MRKQDARTYQITEFMKRLKTFAAQAGVSIVLGCQLDRKLDREKREPGLSDLSDSGGVEKESVSVGLMWEDKEDEEVGPSGGLKKIRWKTAKARKGRVGRRINLSFREDFVQMLSDLYEGPNLPQESAEEKSFAEKSMDWFDN